MSSWSVGCIHESSPHLPFVLSFFSIPFILFLYFAVALASLVGFGSDFNLDGGERVGT